MKEPTEGNPSAEAMREALHKLFRDAGYVQEELLQWIDEAERRSAADRDSIVRLQADNERLKAQLRKQRTAQTGAMSSRLMDALRE
ncbi:MAG: hypothetical protein K0Q59_3628 [Paenibacillus sp.]|nr:hypothetical protein [Paenibacillus sp.]